MGEETGANVLMDLSRTQQFVEILETGKILNDRYEKIKQITKIRLIKIKQNLIIRFLEMKSLKKMRSIWKKNKIKKNILKSVEKSNSLPDNL